MAQCMEQVVEKYGPYGSQCATNWSMMLDECDTIKEVIIRHANIVDGIGFVIADATGCTTTRMVGGHGGKMSKLVLRPNEYITQLSGTHGEHKGSGYERRITSLRIHTNLCPGGYGPYGLAKNVQNVCSFATPLAMHDPIVGFFGRQGKLLDSIGIYVKKREFSPY
ncbi:Mannose/glucose-specific lectin [Bienertia sinuspersici]